MQSSLKQYSDSLFSRSLTGRTGSLLSHCKRPPLPPESTAQSQLEDKAEQEAKEEKREALQRKVQLAQSFAEQEQQQAIDDDAGRDNSLFSTFQIGK